jgi:hypothetical protein
MFVVPGLGLLGAYFDVYVGWTFLDGIKEMSSDMNAFASEHPLVVFFFNLMFPDFDSSAEQMINAVKTASITLVFWGLLERSRHFSFFCGGAPSFWRCF